MGVMDLGLLDRDSGPARPFVGREPFPAETPVRALRSAPPALSTGGRYTPKQSRGAVLAVIVALHVVAIGLLASARYHAEARDRQERITSFAIQEPPPPPPLEPSPSEPAAQPVSAPMVAPAAAIEIARSAEVQAVRPEAVQPTLAPVAVVGNAMPAPAPARPAPAAVAPVVPPDFSASQLRNPGPAYPFLSRRAREEGVVLLKVLVSTHGRAARLEIDKSSGFERLDEAALKTVAKWRFVPASQAGQPREAWVLVPVTFSLD